MALIRDAQGLRKPLRPARLAAVGQDEEGDARLLQFAPPGLYFFRGDLHGIRYQGIVQVGQQELDPPGAEPLDVDGIDTLKEKIRD